VHGQLKRLHLACNEFPDAEQRIREWDDGASYSLLDMRSQGFLGWSSLDANRRPPGCDPGRVAPKSD
jgi:hypothetical protein